MTAFGGLPIADSKSNIRCVFVTGDAYEPFPHAEELERRRLMFLRANVTPLPLNGSRFMDSLRREFQTAVDQSFKSMVVWYGGHGNQESGAWQLSADQHVSCSEILGMWDSVCTASGRNGAQLPHLYITADACNSGSWIKELTPAKCKFLNVSMLVSSRPGEVRSVSADQAQAEVRWR